MSTTYVQEVLFTREECQHRSKWLTMGGDFVTRLGDNTQVLVCTAFQLAQALELEKWRVSGDRHTVSGMFTPAGGKPRFMTFKAQL
jgi:hypothetical protein